MMNVLTDILCDTSSMMPPQSFKGTLSQNKISQHDISSKQGSLHILDSVSQMSNIDRPLSSVNHSSPSNINIFNSSTQIHIPSNIDSGFQERNDVSVFSDSFAEIVPSWLAHDFMKVSENLPSPGILSNVSDIYSTNRENEHLEMLDLGFPPELTSQDDPNNLNRSCIDESQKLLVELPMQRFSTSDSLIIPSFNDMNNTHLHISMNKNDMQYQKYKQNGHDVDSARSLINSVLPCENELLHLPLPSSLTEQCLNSSSSPTIISNSQSQSHVDVVCDKLPQINLNHLDSLLGNETALSDIQLLRHDFPAVRLTEESSNSHTNRACLGNYNPNGSLISCNVSNVITSNAPSLPHVQDVAVQASDKGGINGLIVDINCFSCSEVELELPIETIQCFKCRFCDFISIHKCAVASHINVSHSKTSASTNISENVLTDVRSDNFNTASTEGQNETHLNTETSHTVPVNVAPIINSHVENVMISESEKNSVTNTDKYSCMHCNSFFPNIDEYNSHMYSFHSGKSVQSNQLNPTQNTLIGYQLISINNIITVPSKEQKNPDKSFVIKNISKAQNDFNRNVKRKIFPKKSDDSQTSLKKISHKKSTSENASVNNEKVISSHKKAWQKKMRRELGTYICEFKGCNVRFRAIDNLEYHRKCHSIGESAFACPECGTSFDNWGAVAGHLWRTHGNDMELHACDQCPFRTYSLSRLENIHKLIHRDECLYLCDTCGKSFKNGKQLRNHRDRHSKPKEAPSFKCNTCSNLFKTKRLLLLHESSVHNKIKSYVCKYCDYSTGKKSTLDMHMRQHTGEKPFKCDECSYCTSDHNSLRRHKRKHSGEKPYKCPYCSYSCIQASSYKQHLKRHPGKNEGLMFSCNICSFKTIKQESYILHMCEHESENRPIGENSAAEINTTHEIFPLAEAMDISLSHSDNLLSNFHNKNMQSFFNGFNVNMVSVGQDGVN